jgi:hypothetical protein
MPAVANGSSRHRGVVFLLIAVGIVVSMLWYVRVAAVVPQETLPAFRESPRLEQWAVVVSFFGIKTSYTVLTAVVILALRRRREADLVALRWTMISFFVGEAFCFVNVMAFHDSSVPMEHLHSVGMVLSFAFGIHALLEGMDGRIIHYSDAGRCALAGMCVGCAKHADVPCGLRRAFMVMLPILAVAAAMPLCSSLRDTAYSTQVLGATHVYRHPLVHQVYELRYLPAAAIALFGACLLTVRFVERRAIPISKLLFAAAGGAMGFSLFRMLLVASYIDNQVWFAVCEEMLEFLSIAAICGMLVLFRRKLFVPDAVKGGVDAVGSVAAS